MLIDSHAIPLNHCALLAVCQSLAWIQPQNRPSDSGFQVFSNHEIVYKIGTYTLLTPL